MLADPDDARDAVDLLDHAEAVIDAPLVDEAERHRLEQLASDAAGRPDHWHSVLARRDGEAVGYAGVVIGDGAATADLAVVRDAAPCPPVVTTLLRAVSTLHARHGGGPLQVWMRHAVGSDVVCALDAGYAVDRRLAVLGRRLDAAPPEPELEGDVTLRPMRAEGEDEHVVEVLAAAYGEGPDGGWTLERFRQRRAFEWFDPADVLVLDDGVRLLGLHWTKRRGDGVGEVYNLAIHPDGQGRGFGRALLRAGLAHLRDRGCDDVVLWVDLDNRPGVQLYASEGFTTRWEDIAFTRRVRAS